MRAWIIQWARALGCGLFTRPQTLQELFSAAGQLEELVSVQLGAAFQHEQSYRVHGSYQCVLDRQGYLRASTNILAKLDNVLARAREKVTEIELVITSPSQRDKKSDKQDRQMLAVVTQHLRQLEGGAQRLRALTATEIEKALPGQLLC